MADFGRHVQHARAIARAAHSGIRNADHVAHAPAKEFAGKAACPIPACPALLEARRFAAPTRNPRHVEVFVVEPRLEIRVILEHDRGPTC